LHCDILHAITGKENYKINSFLMWVDQQAYKLNVMLGWAREIVGPIRSIILQIKCGMDQNEMG